MALIFHLNLDVLVSMRVNGSGITPPPSSSMTLLFHNYDLSSLSPLSTPSPLLLLTPLSPLGPGRKSSMSIDLGKSLILCGT
jgi:hypothetical protein